MPIAWLGKTVQTPIWTAPAAPVPGATWSAPGPAGGLAIELHAAAGPMAPVPLTVIYGARRDFDLTRAADDDGPRNRATLNAELKVAADVAYDYDSGLYTVTYVVTTPFGTATLDLTTHGSWAVAYSIGAKATITSRGGRTLTLRFPAAPVKPAGGPFGSPAWSKFSGVVKGKLLPLAETDSDTSPVGGSTTLKRRLIPGTYTAELVLSFTATAVQGPPVPGAIPMAAGGASVTLEGPSVDPAGVKHALAELLLS